MIRKCIRAGAESASEIAGSCGAGSACGGCRPTIETILREERSAATMTDRYPRLSVLQADQASVAS
jgi:bacterioferritin-associated ferredoxin